MGKAAARNKAETKAPGKPPPKRVLAACVPARTARLPPAGLTDGARSATSRTVELRRRIFVLADPFHWGRLADRSFTPWAATASGSALMSRAMTSAAPACSAGITTREPRREHEQVLRRVLPYEVGRRQRLRLGQRPDARHIFADRLLLRPEQPLRSGGRRDGGGVQLIEVAVLAVGLLKAGGIADAKDRKLEPPSRSAKRRRAFPRCRR